MELLNQFRSMDVIVILPAIVCSGVTLSFDEVLLLFPSAVISLVQNCLNLILLLAINDVWGRLKVIGSMFRGFSVG
jgi:hypothetical protein